MKKLTLFFWLIFIFIMSSMDADSSGALSKSIVDILGITISNGHYLVRKMGHAVEFFILGLLVFRITKGNILSLLFPITFACLDEIHQFFVPGRFMFIGDVFIDSTGVVFAFILYRYYLSIKNRLVKN